VTSPPLKAIVASMLSSSDNLTAELLTKELGVKTANAGTTATGMPATTAKLRELGVPIADGALKDGSGLDRGNRITCDNLSRRWPSPTALSSRPPRRPAGAGQNGTLFDQLPDPPPATLQDRFLDGVSGLTGARSRKAHPVRAPRQRPVLQRATWHGADPHRGRFPTHHRSMSCAPQ
jgi:D-alanyl-D-alanine carboxypeptidase/D-alanyl-D-alanine-endopeptidase (penicillin-binding protein 4)